MADQHVDMKYMISSSHNNCRKIISMYTAIHGMDNNCFT